LTLATTWIAYTSQKIKQIVLHAIAFENKEPVFFRTDQTWGRPLRSPCHHSDLKGRCDGLMKNSEMRSGPTCSFSDISLCWPSKRPQGAFGWQGDREGRPYSLRNDFTGFASAARTD
ncbi:MAG: hypothetical protein ACKV1O_02940, partial [Saprospiraceae bacterium]